MWEFLNAQSWQDWLLFLGAIAGAAGLALICHWIIFRVLALFARRTSSTVDELVIKHFRCPARWLMVVVAVRLVSEILALPDGLAGFTKTVFAIALIAMVSWLLIRATFLLNDIVVQRFKVGRQG